MLKKCFTLASVAGLGGLVWLGCSSDDPAPIAPADGGSGSETGSSGGSSGGNGDGGGSSTSEAGSNGGVSGTPIKYGTCDTFAKCGGDLVGSFKVTGGCLGDDTFAPLKAACTGLQERDVALGATGTIKVTATNVERNTVVNVSAKVTVPKDCRGALSSNCDFVETFIKSTKLSNLEFKTVDCADAGQTCDCALVGSLKEESNDTYTVADGVLTTSGAQERTFDYCVTGPNLRYKETTDPGGGGAPLNLTVELAKQ